jgi:endonuclease/exonuclease/phosphatase family metal-dependent hydrolase
VQRELPLVAGMDRNGPKFEGIDTVEWWPRDSMRLLGDDALHDLRAVYLDHLDQHPKRRQRIRDAQRADPLATSYDRGRARPVSSRYDAIYASPDFSVLAAGYDWQRAIEAGSDHALVWADLRLDGGAAAG